MSILSKFLFLNSGKQAITWTDGLADLLPDFLICDVLSVGDAQESSVASHLHALYPPLQLCCKGPCFTSIKEDREGE